LFFTASSSIFNIATDPVRGLIQKMKVLWQDGGSNFKRLGKVFYQVTGTAVKEAE